MVEIINLLVTNPTEPMIVTATISVIITITITEIRTTVTIEVVLVVLSRNNRYHSSQTSRRGKNNNSQPTVIPSGELKKAPPRKKLKLSRRPSSVSRLPLSPFHPRIIRSPADMASVNRLARAEAL